MHRPCAQVLSELPDKIRKRIPVQVTDPARLRALEDTKQAMKGVEQQENSEGVQGRAGLGREAGRWWVGWGGGLELANSGKKAWLVVSALPSLRLPGARLSTRTHSHTPWLPQWGF